MHPTKAILLLALAAAVCPADTLYDNTTTDQLNSAFYSASGVTQIGDQIQLSSAGTLTSLDAQFYNVGSDATFDAVLWFYDVGSPVGSQIGAPFTVTGISIAGGTSATVSFLNLGNLAVPQDLIVTFSVENVSTDGDIGVNFFDPPGTGSSSNSFFIVYDGANFSQASTLLDQDNLYMQISGTAASDVPEPSTAPMVMGALAVLAWGRWRCARARRASSSAH